MSKILVGLLLAVTLTACTSLDETIGIDETDNALQCVNIEASSPNPMVAARGRTKRVELPAGYDTSTIDKETLSELMTWCD